MNDPTDAAVFDAFLAKYPGLEEALHAAAPHERLQILADWVAREGKEQEVEDLYRSAQASPHEVVQGISNLPLGLFQAPEGRPRMNPLYEASLIERAQFDGDMPELRTGPMDPGTSAAPLIQTTARDPVVLGMQLNAAADQIKREVHQARKALAERKEDEAATGGDLVKAKGGPDYSLSTWGDASSDPERYRRGEVPAHLVAVVPTLGAILEVRQDRRASLDAAYKFLSTTQGRKSVLPILAAEIITLLRDEQIEVEWRRDAQNGGPQPLRQATWKIVLAGPQSFQPRSSPLDLAVRSLAYSLLQERPTAPVYLEVGSLDNLAGREVGWWARLMPLDEEQAIR